jgi:hypothetical protein
MRFYRCFSLAVADRVRLKRRLPSGAVSKIIKAFELPVAAADHMVTPLRPPCIGTALRPQPEPGE